MPWRLILFILVFAVLLIFIVFNLDNTCDLNFGFAKFEAVPVFLTVFISFAAGMLCSMPFLLFRKKRKEENPKPKKVWGKKKKDEALPANENSFSDGGPYGVN
jgi:uncharacterized integral membrane protein